MNTKWVEIFRWTGTVYSSPCHSYIYIYMSKIFAEYLFSGISLNHLLCDPLSWSISHKSPPTTSKHVREKKDADW